MRSFIVLATAAAAASVLGGCSYSLVEPGHRGLLFDPDNGIKHEVLGPGNYRTNTFCFLKAACSRVDDFDVTFSTHRETVTVTSAEGLKMTAKLAIIYRPIISELYELDTEVGPNYYDEVVEPEFRSAATGVLTRHSYMELGAKNEKIEDEIETDVRRRIHGKHVEIASITINTVEYAPEIAAANRARIVGEQEAARQKAAIENEDQRKKQQLQHEREQADLAAQNAAELAKHKADADMAEKQHELELAKADVDVAKASVTVAKAKGEQEIAEAKAQAAAGRYLAQAKADENRAEAQAITPLTVQMHAYDALGKLGGEGTTILLGEWSHVPNFLFPRAGAFLNAYGPYAGPSAGGPVSMAPSNPASNPAAKPASASPASAVPRATGL